MKRSSSQILQAASKWSFLAALFFLPFSIAFLEIFLIVTFITWMVRKLLDSEPLSNFPNLVLLLGAFLIISCVSAFSSGHPDLSARGIVKLIRYLLVFLVAADIFRDFRDLKLLFTVLLASFLIVLFDAVAQRFLGADLVHGFKVHYADAQIRVTGPFSFYGLLGAEIIAFLPIVLGKVFSTAEHKNRLIFFMWFCFCVLALYVLYKTHSRGAWIAAFISWIAFAAVTKKRLLLFSLLIIIAVAPLALPKNALIHLDAERKEQSLIERFELWYRAIQVIQKRPIFGCGINTYVRNYPKFDDRKNWRVPGYYVHNGYLHLAAETGLISLLLLLIIFGKSLKSGFKVFLEVTGEQRYFTIGLLCGFIALLVQVAFDTTLHNLQSSVLIWLFAGLLLSASYPSRKNQLIF